MAGPGGDRVAANGDVERPDAAGEQAGAATPAERASPPRRRTPPDELLCTICGLKACWQAPPARRRADSELTPS
jgi:hypothetical protein